MNPTIIKEINSCYQSKKSKAFFELEKRKKKIYLAIPRLEEIDNEINNYALESVRSILVCEKEEQYSYVKNLENKIQELNDEKLKILKEKNIDPNELEPKFECSKCKDTGFVDGQKCSCYEQMLLDYSYNNSNLKNFSNQTFENFDIDVYSDQKTEGYNVSPKENMEYIRKVALNFVDNFDNPQQKNLFFSGTTGLGKTFLSSCIANELLKRGKTVLYQTASTLLDTIVDYKLNKSDKSKNIYSQIFDVDLLIIDDLGVEYLNNLNSVELFNILNNRLISAKNVKTIISTNLDLNRFRDRYDDRLVSRIIGNYTICGFWGDDIRLIKR